MHQAHHQQLRAGQNAAAQPPLRCTHTSLCVILAGSAMQQSSQAGLSQAWPDRVCCVVPSSAVIGEQLPCC